MAYFSAERGAVVAADCRSGPREILNNGEAGVLVPVDDSAALARETIALLSRAKEWGEKARRRALDFDAARVTREYEKLF